MNVSHLRRLLAGKNLNRRELFPEAAPRKLAAAARTAYGRSLLRDLDAPLLRPGDLPPLTHSLYRDFRRTGRRASFQEVYFNRRGALTAATLSAVCRPQGRPEALEITQDWL